MPRYQGKDVEIVHEIGEGDEGYDAKTPKVVVRLEGGEETIVAKSEVEGADEEQHDSRNPS